MQDRRCLADHVAPANGCFPVETLLLAHQNVFVSLRASTRNLMLSWESRLYRLLCCVSSCHRSAVRVGGGTHTGGYVLKGLHPRLLSVRTYGAQFPTLGGMTHFNIPPPPIPTTLNYCLIGWDCGAMPAMTRRTLHRFSVIGGISCNLLGNGGIIFSQLAPIFLPIGKNLART